MIFVYPPRMKHPDSGKNPYKIDSDFLERVKDEFIDHLDEELELSAMDPYEDSSEEGKSEEEIRSFRRLYLKELHRLQIELVKLQDWVVSEGKKIVVVFEGRDSAGKGGVISRVTQRLNPRVCRVAALPVPSDREKTQWYFQRYAQHLPAAGEIVLFDRSWYNRSGVERVMGFCTEEELEEYFRTVNLFEDMLIGSGIQLIKYWISLSDKEQIYRFHARIHDPLKRWKLSPMDLQSRIRWEQYTKAKEEMFRRTHTEKCPWWVVPADNKKKARLNCIHHLLSMVPYEAVEREDIQLPPGTDRKVTGDIKCRMRSSFRKCTKSSASLPMWK